MVEKINQKLVIISKALETLGNGVMLYGRYTKIVEIDPSLENQELLLSMRDSMIQRFEYCTDLFWKVLKIYLEQVENITLPINSPRVTIRESVTAKIITEKESEQSLNMVKNRNETSHIYHEETAEDIAQNIPEYYRLMITVIGRLNAVTAGRV